MMAGRQLWVFSLLSMLFALCYSVEGSTCGADYFNCTASGGGNSTCIPRAFMCNGNQDCSDGSDENGCPPTSDGKCYC